MLSQGRGEQRREVVLVDGRRHLEADLPRVDAPGVQLLQVAHGGGAQAGVEGGDLRRRRRWRRVEPRGGTCERRGTVLRRVEPLDRRARDQAEGGARVGVRATTSVDPERLERARRVERHQPLSLGGCEPRDLGVVGLFQCDPQCGCDLRRDVDRGNRGSRRRRRRGRDGSADASAGGWGSSAAPGASATTAHRCAGKPKQEHPSPPSQGADCSSDQHARIFPQTDDLPTSRATSISHAR